MKKFSSNHLAMGALAATALLLGPGPASAQGLTLANPDWNITLSDFGYSDFLLDNTPGFEGREYLSGEWGAAVGYQLASGGMVAPQWLEPHFLFPDWDTHSTFQVVAPLTQTGLNAENLPMAQSVVANTHLEITLRHEMLDTVVGTPMGTKPASATDPGVSINSGRYVLKQTCTIKNITGAPISNLRLFQFLHGLQSQRGVFDNRVYPGPLSQFSHDVTMAGVDTAAVGAGSSSAGLEDFIGFHAVTAPGAYELGYYGVEGNGVDDHAMGKPSDGVHLSVEDNWQTPPFSARLNTDDFAPPQRWIAGAQRWDLGALGSGQSTSLELLLSVRTGTRVVAGPGSLGGCNGGSGVPGGVDYEFEDVSIEGSCFAEYSKADASEIAVRISQGEFEPFTFLTPAEPEQLWKMGFSGAYSGNINLSFGYDPTLLPPGFDESTLTLYEYTDGTWRKLTGTVDQARHVIDVTTTDLAVFALGTEGGATYTVDASVAPANSGTVSGAGAYADGSSATLVASPEPGHVFANWTEDGTAVGASPSFTFLVRHNRALMANFTAVGNAKSISTSALPANGGSTTGDGAYALGAIATVSARPNAGYKFSKWLLNGVQVSSARDYTFTVDGDRALVAKFKPVYSVVVLPDPPEGGELEADPVYESGELAKLKAKPNPGYSFVNWTQNAIQVSTDPNYQFNVNGNRELVGHFALGYRFDVVPLPANAGAASGGGVFASGTSVTVDAIANPGYVFLNWTEGEGGTDASTSPSYTLDSDANHTLVANFIAQPSLAAAMTEPGIIKLSWPAGAAGWRLEESPDFNPNSWVGSTRQESTIDGRKQVTISPQDGRVFFRLVYP